MATIPTAISPLSWQVVFQIEGTVSYVTSREKSNIFGTVVLVGMNVLTVSVDEIIFATNCTIFEEGGCTYAITEESNVKFKYTVPP